ncbi:M16 family metallopeptidase [Paragemmobacter straminiformis]|uniref:Insulinase family protein n=1 Tax=Paragemmobacter straminiformis TaxID=2045119 RepID=A0A842I982_9RHOB|nr:pitrilysin family protein [Gemmobacter straminiformis]MBC2836176.1 insulinase family protein [Gemmobacter straminiformis]
MVRGLGFVVAALVLFTPFRAAWADDVSTFKLANGLEVVVIEDHRAPVVVHMVWYRVGSADEPAGKSGIAHFLEHLMFKGTKTLGPGEFSDTVEAQGGDDNAFTSWDYTAFFQHVSADRLPLMMQIEADRMQNLQLTDDVVKPERDVIVEERNQRTDTSPGALLTEQMRAAQYLNSPYRIPIIGWKHEMSTLTRDDALAFYKAHYAPNNAILVVAGDVTPDQVKTLAETYYGPIPPAAHVVPRQRPQDPPQLAERRLVYKDPRVSEPYLTRSYLAPERDAGDQKTAAALAILAELLGGNGQTSVLAQALQFGDAPKATYAAAIYDGSSLDDTTFTLLAVPVPEVTLEALEAEMDKVIAKFMAEGPDPKAFARIKTQIRAADIYARDDSRGLAQRYGEGLATGLTVEDIKAWPAVLDSVTTEDVMAAAKLVFDRKNAVTGYLMQDEAAQ